MKKFALLAFLVGCGGTQEGIDKTQSAFSYGPTSKLEHIMTNFNCRPNLVPNSSFQFGALMGVYPLGVQWGPPYESATYGVDFYASPHETLSMAMTTLPLVESMDGPYHILTNPWPGGLGMWLTPQWYIYPQLNGYYRYPAAIPAYGIVIYAAGERSDYPTGVAVLTLDPANNPVDTTANRFEGRCDYRKTFVFAL